MTWSYVRIALIIYTRHMTSKDCYKFSFIPRTIIQCIRKRCFLYHVTGSERPNYIPLNSDQHNPNSRPQNLGLPASLQRNSNPKTPPRPIQYCPNDSDYVRSHDLYAEQGPNPRSDIGNCEHYNPNHFPNPRLDSSSRDISDSFVHSFLGQMKELQSQVLSLQRQQQIMFQFLQQQNMQLLPHQPILNSLSPSTILNGLPSRSITIKAQ